ncbi:DUF3500 domain-containing protein [Chitinophaga sp.]|uniref:DUF3500 domain-containing protein n=1 Tax=Chitinophaga sp. TaxID=1869181 RepID=UPI0031E0F133
MKKNVLLLFATALVTMIVINACKKDTSGSNSSSASITAISCSSVTFSDSATSGTAYSGTATVPYTGGNGATYSAGSAISSTGVTGLTATLQAGTLASGSGNLTYSISGTPADSGTAYFAISFGGQSCTLALTVDSGTTTASSDCTSKTGIEKVLCLISSLESSVTSTQLASLQISYAYSYAIRWSNFPDAIYGNRIGLKFSDMTTAQIALADSLLKAVSGVSDNEGFSELMQLLAADNYLNANGGGSDYGQGNFHICILGTPSTSGTFEVYFGGHHTQLSNTYINGTLVGGTPSFRGVEPCAYSAGTSFSYSGTSIVPLDQEATALSGLLTGLSSSNLSSAYQSATYSDLVCGPQKDWSFPTTSIGVKGSSLSSSEQALLLKAIKTYVDDIADSSSFITTYTNELSDTYVAYSGTTALKTKYDYIRIDGPHVWIEYSVGSGVVLQSYTHPHSVWRDKSYDYGGTTN